MSHLPPKVTLMSVSTSNTYMKLQNFRKLGKNAKLSKKRTLPISGQNLFPQWCPLIRDYTVYRNHTSSNIIMSTNTINDKTFYLKPIIFCFFPTNHRRKENICEGFCKKEINIVPLTYVLTLLKKDF